MHLPPEDALLHLISPEKNIQTLLQDTPLPAQAGSGQGDFL